MDLRERMTLTHEGQVTWANPDIGKKCYQCVYAVRNPNDMRKKCCAMVKAVTGKNGKPYDVDRAIACSKFSEVDTTTTK